MMRPNARPAIAPDRVTRIDSAAIVPHTCQRHAPSARGTPISRVRSSTDMASVLTTPSRAFVAAAVVGAVVLAVAWAMTCVAGMVVGASVDAGALAAGFADVWPRAMAFACLGVLAVGLTSRPA